MANVKIMNPVEGETNEQRIKRCANNLLKAVLAGGYDIRKTAAISGFDVDIFSRTNELQIRNGITNVVIRCGRPSVSVKFADMFVPKYDDESLAEDTTNAD